MALAVKARMIIWILASFFILLGLKMIWPAISKLVEAVETGRQKKMLEQVSVYLREIEETLLAGLVPNDEKWRKVRDLPAPWGKLTAESLEELRQCGGSLIPTLKRLRNLAEEQSAALVDARARSSQAVAQAMVCSMLVPLLGGALYTLLPELEQNSKLWVVSCFFAMLLTVAGSIWLLRMTVVARWGGLRLEFRPWILGSLCAGERFLALVRAGNTPDLAWARAYDLIKQDACELAVFWGASIWDIPQINRRSVLEQVIVNAGGAIKKSVQVSLMEGTPCTERVEAVLYALKQDIQAQVQRELALLGTKGLKPLFLCIAPALFSLLGGGLWITAKSLAF